MSDIIFSTWQGQVIDNRGKAANDFIPLQDVTLPLEFSKGKRIKAFFGWEGIIIRDEVDLVEMTSCYLDAVSQASCGKCFPCRVGTSFLASLMSKVRAGRGDGEDLARIGALCRFIADGSKCSIGQRGPIPVLHVLEHFPEVFSDYRPAETTEKRVEYLSSVVAPCSAACPANLEVPKYIEEIREGRFTAALETIGIDTCLPGTLGRVCVRPCESNCRRALVDEAVSIKFLKRFAADFELKRLDKVAAVPGQKRNQRVAVIGAGPAGLSCAYYLALKGYSVVIYERHGEPGGMAAMGIPDYRLPRAILRQEVELIKQLGVEIRYQVNIGQDISLSQLAQQYDALFIGVGAQDSTKLGAEGEDAGYLGFIPGVRYLEAINLGYDPYPEGKKVVVVGGGNTAIDGVRSSFRLGKKNVNLVYRRTRKEMPADPVEIHDAEAEGVIFHFLCNPVRILAEGGRVVGMECIRMELGEPDQSGRRRPIPVPNSEFIIEADIVVPAIGQAVDISFLRPEDGIRLTRWNSIEVNEETFETSRRGIFAAGDCVTGPDVLVRACGNGRKAAAMIDNYLQGRDLVPTQEERFNILYNKLKVFNKKEQPNLVGGRPRLEPRTLPPESRKWTFDEVEAGFRLNEAIAEASRCLRCLQVGMVAL